MQEEKSGFRAHVRHSNKILSTLLLRIEVYSIEIRNKAVEKLKQCFHRGKDNATWHKYHSQQSPDML